MKNYVSSIFTFFILMIWMSSASAQGGNINEFMQCTLKPGFTVEEIISVGRAIPRTDNGPNLVFYREPIVASTSREGSINVVRYWDNFEHMIKGLESQSLSGPSSHFFAMVDCGGSRQVGRNWTANEPGQANPYEGGEIEESYVAIRQCRLNPGKNMEDVQQALAEFDENNRTNNDKSGFGYLQILASGEEGDMNSAFAVRVIGENSEGLGRRLDAMSWNTPSSSDPATCGNLSLWKSHVIHWGT
ncbi:MAG: hypothetical protein OSB72_13425 [Gammaproteobacteria bacterium]|nr:hypothetical protein [Gammaproteobacteria bacterium]